MKIRVNLCNSCLLLCLLCLFAAKSSAQTPVLFSLQNLTGTIGNQPILIQPDREQNLVTYGTNLVPTYDFTIQPANGQVITNLIPWGYTITVAGWTRGVHIIVPALSPSNGSSSNGPINVVSLINTNRFAPLNLSVAPQLNGGENINLVTNPDSSVTISDPYALTASSTVAMSQVTGPLPLPQLPHGVATNYDLADFGAYGDARPVPYFYAWPSTPFAYSPYGQFTTNDNGAYCMINFGGTNGAFWLTGISNVYSSTLVMLSNAPMNAVSNMVFWGQYPYTNSVTNATGSYALIGHHNDRPAVQAAIAYAATNGGGVVNADYGVFLLIGGTNNANCAQIVLPYPYINGSAATYPYSSCPTVRLQGKGMAKAWGANPWWGPPAGSTVFASAEVGGVTTNPIGVSIFDGRVCTGIPSSLMGQFPGIPKLGYGQYITNNFLRFDMADLTILKGFNANLAAINDVAFAEPWIHNVSVIAGLPTSMYDPEPWVGPNDYGIIMPDVVNGLYGLIDGDSLLVVNCTSGIDIGLIDMQGGTIVGCSNAFSIFTSGSVYSRIQNVQIVQCYNVVGQGTNSGAPLVSPLWLDIGQLACYGTNWMLNNGTMNLMPQGANGIAGGYIHWPMPSLNGANGGALTLPNPQTTLAWRYLTEPASVGASSDPTAPGITHYGQNTFTSPQNAYSGSWFGQGQQDLTVESTGAAMTTTPGASTYTYSWLLAPSTQHYFTLNAGKFNRPWMNTYSNLGLTIGVLTTNQQSGHEEIDATWKILTKQGLVTGTAGNMTGTSTGTNYFEWYNFCPLGMSCTNLAGVTIQLQTYSTTNTQYLLWLSVTNF